GTASGILSRNVDHTAVACFRAEGDASFFLVPHHGTHGSLAGTAQKDFLRVGEAHGHDHAVVIADGDYFLPGVASHACDHEIAARSKFERGLAHRAVLGLERPDNRGWRA